MNDATRLSLLHAQRAGQEAIVEVRREVGLPDDGDMVDANDDTVTAYIEALESKVGALAWTVHAHRKGLIP